MTIATATGLRRIEHAFAAARAEGRAAFMPYFTAGFPDEVTSEEILVAIAQAGADLIELGVPFSDPIADGPVIQRSTQVALEGGMTAAKAVRLARRLRSRGVTQPIMFMGYTNPISAYGLDRYVDDVASAGGDGLIVPDLPLEEAADLEAACARTGLALTYLAAPTSPPAGCMTSRSTPAASSTWSPSPASPAPREGLPPDLGDFVARARAVAHTPIAVGFGVARPDQAAAIGQFADGVIVGSALIKAVAGAADLVAAATEFVKAMRGGLGRR